MSTVIVIHGLGEDPRAMACWSDLLVQNGMNVLNILLAGHGRGTEALAQTSLSQWRLDVVRATEIAKDLTDEVHLWGFSLGGTLALDAVLRRPVEFRGATLLSPGLAMSDVWNQRVTDRLSEGKLTLTDFRTGQKYEPIPLSVLGALNHAIEEVQTTIEALRSSIGLPPIGLVTASRDQLVNTKVAEKVARRLGLSIWKLPISEHNLLDSGLDLVDFLKFAQNHCGLGAQCNAHSRA